MYDRTNAGPDFVNPQERIKELSYLISSLPLTNYSLLRALTAHLILIVQNAGINKMTMRNVGIVFSPTLGIPAGVFSLMLGEFERVFNVDGTLDEAAEPTDSEEAQNQSAARRNSQHYSEAAADQMLGLSGRALPGTQCISSLLSPPICSDITSLLACSTPTVQQEDAQSDDDDDVLEGSSPEATTENDGESYVESSAASSSTHAPQAIYVEPPAEPSDYSQQGQSSSRSRAAKLAATRGLSVATDKASRRHSRMVGLPASPRPPPQPMPQGPQQSQGGPPSPHSSGEGQVQNPHSPSSDSPHRPT